MKVSLGRDEAAARKAAFELWPNTLVPGQLSQELALPSHFDQARFFEFYRRELAPRLS